MPAPSVTDLVVCTTCRPAGTSRELPAAGVQLLESVLALMPHAGSADLRVRGIACLSACSRSCTAAMQAPNKHTYCFGDLGPDADTAAQLLACARQHAHSADGSLPRSERPPRLRDGIIAKLPPCSVT